MLVVSLYRSLSVWVIVTVFLNRLDSPAVMCIDDVGSKIIYFAFTLTFDQAIEVPRSEHGVTLDQIEVQLTL